MSEAKFDTSFFIGQFKIPSLLGNLKSRFWRLPSGDTVTSMVDDFLFFVREDIPAKHFSNESSPIEGTYVELNFLKKNWLCCCHVDLQSTQKYYNRPFCQILSTNLSNNTITNQLTLSAPGFFYLIMPQGKGGALCDRKMLLTWNLAQSYFVMLQKNL